MERQLVESLGSELGEVGIMPPAAFAKALSEAQALAGPGRPLAANLLPFTKRAHVRACIEARVPVVVLHAGRLRPDGPRPPT